MERKLFTTREFLASGRSRHELYWLAHKQKIVSVERGVWAPAEMGIEPLDRAVARTLASRQVATGLVGGALYGLDAIDPATVVLPSRRRTVAFGGSPNEVG